ncbi:MAG TPA: beta-ketoacyl synthase N-terminal-like domain-containing protein, partial [Thermoleophilaceae bacterium]
MSAPAERREEIIRRALVELGEARDRVAELERARKEPIAIVGLACRFPGGADTPERYWELLAAGRDAVTEVPPERWSLDAV